MKLTTRHFGEIEFPDETIINFPEGLVGFEDQKRFVFIENSDPEVPFHWLQSVDQEDLAFVVVNPMAIKPDYEFEVPKDIEKRMELDSAEDVALLSIVVVPEEIEKMTMNLLAPLVFNAAKRIGFQVVLIDERYTTKHLVAEELEKATARLEQQAGGGAK